MKEIESIIIFPQYLRAKMMRIVIIQMVTAMPANVNATLIMSMQKIVHIMDVSTYTVQVLFGAGNQSNHQNFEKSLLSCKCGLIFIGMEQKKNIENWRFWKTTFFWVGHFAFFFFKKKSFIPKKISPYL